jgi:uncharacterized membrane protein
MTTGGILQANLPNNLGNFGEKMPVNLNGPFLSLCIICRILPSIYTNMIQSQKSYIAKGKGGCGGGGGGGGGRFLVVVVT